MYHVNLTYFKSSGKYYCTGMYTSEQSALYEIWEEVKRMQNEGKLPGLIEGARMPIIQVKVRKHPHRHPHLIIDSEMRST